MVFVAPFLYLRIIAPTDKTVLWLTIGVTILVRDCSTSVDIPLIWSLLALRRSNGDEPRVEMLTARSL